MVAYLGVPLHLPGGRVLGAVSVIQREAREWTDEDRRIVEGIANAVEGEIERKALLDQSHAVMANLTDLVSVVDREGKLLYSSPSIRRILGYDAADLDGLQVVDVVHPEDRGALADARRNILAEPESIVTVTLRVRQADGRQRILEARLTNLLDDPAVAGILCVSRDVTDRAHAEGRLKLILGHAPVALWTVDTDLRFTWVGGRAAEGMMSNPEELVGMTIPELFETGDPDFAPLAAYRAALAGRRGRFDVDWGERTWEVQLSPIGEDPVRGVVGVASDVTEHRRIERRLEERTIYFQRLFEESPEAIALVDPDDCVLQINPEFERLFGYSAEEAEGRPIEDLITVPGVEHEASEITARVAEGERVEIETVRRRKDGTPIHVSILATPVLVGQERQVYGIYRDITERKELEARLLHSQRLDAVGQLAGGVAHDFNNILTVILGHLQVLLQQYREDRVLREDLEEVQSAAQRAARLTRQLLTFSRRDTTSPSVVNLNDVVRETRELLERLIEERIEIVFDLDDSIPLVEADPSQLEQVVMNLVINSRDAMPRGGRIRVSTGSGEPGDRAVCEHIHDSPWVSLLVEDDGAGMSAEEEARMFEPFFTTKEPGEGTGLGLSTVYGIVERAGGQIEVRTAPGRGTRIRVCLPAAAPGRERVAARKPTRTVEDRGGGGHLVLLVDDDRPVRSVTRRILERSGYDVLEAESGEAALELMDRADRVPAAVVSDVVMPGMSGYELVEHLRRRHPGIGVVLMTGYTAPGSGDEALERTLLRKPFDATTLVRRVRQQIAPG